MNEPMFSAPGAEEQTEKQAEGMAVASLVLGIVTLVLFCFWPISVPTGIIGLVLGIIAMRGTKRGIAMVGAILSGVGILVVIVVVVLAVLNADKLQEFNEKNLRMLKQDQQQQQQPAQPEQPEQPAQP
jgi:hypothetical protein